MNLKMLYYKNSSVLSEVISETSSVTSKEDKQEEEVIIDAIQSEAALKIQSAFRGYKVNERFSHALVTE